MRSRVSHAVERAASPRPGLLVMLKGLAELVAHVLEHALARQAGAA